MFLGYSIPVSNKSAGKFRLLSNEETDFSYLVTENGDDLFFLAIITPEVNI